MTRTPSEILGAGVLGALLLAIGVGLVVWMFVIGDWATVLVTALGVLVLTVGLFALAQAGAEAGELEDALDRPDQPASEGQG